MDAVQRLIEAVREHATQVHENALTECHDGAAQVVADNAKHWRVLAAEAEQAWHSSIALRATGARAMQSR